MAEEREAADRTEEPSQRRLDQARERGQVVASRELGHVLVLGCALLLTLAAGPWSAERLTRGLRTAFAAGAATAADTAGWRADVLVALGEAGFVLAIWLAALLAAGLVPSVLQRAVVWTPQPLVPKLERISPLAGLGRLFSAVTLVELGKGLLKLTIVGVAAWLALRRLAPESGGLTGLPAAAVLPLMVELSMWLVGSVLAALVVLAGLDWLWQRQQHLRQLRMTRQEVKEELRETEGDPIVKQRLRQLRLQRARRRMMAEVPKATVVVTNPTHYAVALRYDAATMAAPKLVAKGVDALALAIRDLAREHGVPVVENPPLARALHAALEPGQTVPPAHFQAVAELIAYVWRLARPVSPTPDNRG